MKNEERKSRAVKHEAEGRHEGSPHEIRKKRAHEITVDAGKCVGCGLCAKTCVAHNITIQHKKAHVSGNDCVMCGQCTAVCPKEAITISGYSIGEIRRREEQRLNPKQVLNAIRFRRSVRQFQDTTIPRGVIEQILEAGRLTHTARNTQDVSYVVLEKEKDRVEQMAVDVFRKIKPLASVFSPMARRGKVDRNFFFFKAPTVIVILAENKTNGLLAAQNMEFVAEAHGLGVLFSGFFTIAANTSPEIRRALRIPKKKHVAMTLVLGYPDVHFLRSTPHEKLKVRYM